jgi:transposase-like protein
MPRTIRTRIGPLTVEVPRARGVEFYPSAQEKRVRCGRALKLAVAEMYVQGTSTWIVAAITEQVIASFRAVFDAPDSSDAER